MTPIYAYIQEGFRGFQDTVFRQRNETDVLISLDYNELIKRQKRNHFCAVPAEVKVQGALHAALVMIWIYHNQ